MTSIEVPTEPSLAPVSRSERGSEALPGQISQHQIEAADEAARQAIRSEQPENTKRAHRSNWRVWDRFCREYGLSTTLATVATLTAFVRWMYERGYAYESAHRILYGTRTVLRQQGIELSSQDSAYVTEALRNYQRTVAEEGEIRGRGKARAIRLEEVHQVCASLPDTLAGKRDRLLWGIGFGTGCRRSELSRLTLADVGVHPEGLLIRVRWSKTKRPRMVTVTPSQDPQLCPVRAWKEWLRASDMDQVPSAESHQWRVFRQVNRHDAVLDQGLSPDGVNQVITRTAKRAGVNAHVTAHSLRAGMATEARRAGYDAVAIARQGGWVDGSSVVHGYIQTVAQWDECVLKGIW